MFYLSWYCSSAVQNHGPLRNILIWDEGFPCQSRKSSQVHGHEGHHCISPSPVPSECLVPDTRVVYGWCYHGFLSKHAGSPCFPLSRMFSIILTHTQGGFPSFPRAELKHRMDHLHGGCFQQWGSAELSMGRALCCHLPE